ncbi:exported hypothetical protein [Cupriavidus oxalaticus]|uniref:Uncharacterized protein n=1 Tax=Cupriavidus oxalaticus TaxID=96344 RepID=A0A976GAB5_9BURK|nr:exported hypothetical protein [Cupriavidus oxalaticus]
MRTRKGRAMVVLVWIWALVLMIGSLPGSMQSASTKPSLQTNYYIENLIIYTYVLGQIYSTFEDKFLTCRFAGGARKQKAAAEIPLRPCPGSG